MNALSQFKFAVVGSGAVGGYYGAKLAHHGRDVRFLMRSDLAFVKEHGLTVRSPEGLIHLDNVHACASTGQIGPSDVVLIALKATSNSALEKLIPPLLKDDTILLTLQNGLGNDEFLAGRFGAERVMGGLCFVCLNRVAPGVIEHYGHGRVSIGEFQRPPLPRTLEMVAEFQACGIDTSLVDNLVAERWRKLVWNVPFNGLSIAAGKVTVGEILADEGLRSLVRSLMREVIDSAGKLGCDIPLDFIDDNIRRSLPMGDYRPSSLLDFAAGRAVEVEAIWGEPYRRAVRAGADVPRLEMLYFLLKKLTRELGAESGQYESSVILSGAKDLASDAKSDLRDSSLR